jgi:hypothetical protein
VGGFSIGGKEGEKMKGVRVWGERKRQRRRENASYRIVKY